MGLAEVIQSLVHLLVDVVFARVVLVLRQVFLEQEVGLVQTRLEV